MDDFIDCFKLFFYNIKYYRFRPDKESFWCKIGFHKMKRGFGWTKTERFDCCYKCNYSKWRKDKMIGWYKD